MMPPAAPLHTAIAKTALALLEQAQVPVSDIALRDAQTVRGWLTAISEGRLLLVSPPPPAQPAAEKLPPGE